MSGFAVRLLNMSLSSCWLILVIVLLRFMTRKYPKKLHCLLWAAAAVRLSVPFRFKSVLSLLPSGEILPEHVASEMPAGIITVADNQNLPAALHLAMPEGMLNSKLWTASGYVWILGFTVMLLFALVCSIYLSGKVSASMEIGERIFICDDISYPFTFGLFSAAVYLPSGLDERVEKYALLHEKAHIKRLDHVWKFAAYLILSVHWFNPLCWIAFILFCRDVEFACDEAVTAVMDKDEILSYSEALLQCAVQKRTVMVLPAAFAEVAIKERIVTIMENKKHKKTAIAAVAVLCAAAVLCFVLDPVSAFTGKNEKMCWPCESKKITSPYGERIHPITGTTDDHKFVDIRCEENEEIHAVLSGVVVQVGFDDELGNYVIIDHGESGDKGENVRTVYGHLNSAEKSEGDTVSAGSVIGLAGSTGTSTGAHLDFGVLVNGEYADPEKYLE